MPQPTYYRIAPEYRRSCIYVAASFLFLLAPLGMAVCMFVHQRPLASSISCLAMCIAVGLAALLPLRWSLRVDGRGLARRLLFRYDRWDWTDLASGRIEKRHPFVLADPGRPWWRRTLNLGYMTDDDRRVVIEQINEHYRLPPPPEIPDTLRLKSGLRTTATFDAKGLTLITRGRPQAFLWNEIRRVHVTRMDPLRRDFVVLEIFVADEVIELRLVNHEGGSSLTWRGATSEQINEFLIAHLPPERIEEDIAGGPAATREDAERALGAAKKKLREASIILGAGGALLAAVFIWMVLTKGWAAAVGLMLLSWLWIVPVFWCMRKMIADRVREREEALATFEEKPQGVPTDP